VTATLVDFRTQFPEFADTADADNRQRDADVEAALERAEGLWALSDIGTLYVAAHILALAAEAKGAADGGSGVVISERVGPQSVTYMTQAGGGPEGGDPDRVWYATTTYGRAFLAFRAVTPEYLIPAMAVG